MAQIFGERHSAGIYVWFTFFGQALLSIDGVLRMPLAHLPLLGPFAVHPDGRLVPRGPDASPCFSVQWRGRQVRARMVQTGPAAGSLVLQTILGRIPSSASLADEALRPRSFALLHALIGSLPDTWRLRLTPDHRALLETELRIALPATAVELVTGVAIFLLGLAPYLDLLDESGLLPGSGG
ncbi:MAG TPA: hypothetical protein VIG49_00610 [Acetobacteraceae bacterium]